MATRRDDVVDVLHGVEVPDPYRWLEDGADPAVQEWTRAQNEQTRAVLDARPGRGRAAGAAGRAARCAHGRRRAGGRRPAVHRRAGRRPRPGRAVRPRRGRRRAGRAPPAPRPAAVPRRGDRRARLVPPVTRRPAGGRGHLARRRRAQHPPGDRRRDRRDAARRAPEHPGCRRSRGCPTRPRSRTPATPTPTRCRPRSAATTGRSGGTSSAPTPPTDTVVFDDLPDPTAWPEVSLSKDGRWFLFHVALGWDRIDVHLEDRTTGERTTVIEGVDAVTALRGGGRPPVGTTTLDAPRGRVVEAPLDAPAPDRWTTLGARGTLGDRRRGRHRPLARSCAPPARRSPASTTTTSTAASTATCRCPARRRSRRSTAATTGTRPGWRSRSFARPPRLHRWTPEHLDPWGADDPTIDPDAYVVEQVRYPSTDGTDVGLLMLRRADTVTGPDTPTILTGYGGFAITMSPEYNAVAVAHCDAGGLWAVAGLRGGSRGGRGLAPRRHARQQAAGVRRLRGRRRLAGRRRAHLARAAGDPRAAATAACWWPRP